MADPTSITGLATEHGGRLLETILGVGGAAAALIKPLTAPLTAKLDKIVDLLTDIKAKGKE